MKSEFRMHPEVQPARIKVLTMVTSFHIGGTERQVANLVLGMDHSRFELHLACMRRMGALLKEVETLDVPHPVFPILSLYRMRTVIEALKLMRYIRKNAIQIVHTYGLYPNLFAVPAAWLSGAPVVIASIRDRGDILTPAQRWFQKLVCRFADCVLVNAEAIREALIEQGYRPSKIAIIRNGIAPSKFGMKHAASGIREQLGIPAGAPLVIALSRLNPMKGIEYFLTAASLITLKLPEVRFLVVGDGAIKGELQEYANGLGLSNRVVFTGFRTDIPSLLAETTLSVLPSLSEGLSNTLLESMAAGVPVVATRVGGNTEIVEDGVSGYLVPLKDPGALAKAMETVLQDPALAERMGKAGQQRTAELFGMERSIREVERLYMTLAGTVDEYFAEAPAQ
jgi:L-malate glycosyltransferase